jgi:predicted transport protein
LGQEWKRIHETLLHTAGNLTLTGYNSEYSDRSFNEKREMNGGFKDSPLRVNAGLGSIDKWNEESILNRADSLAGKAAEIWSVPVLESSVLKLYIKKEKTPSSFTINDHPNLTSVEMNSIFEAFRREVLALDPCITEEFLKLYVAYKAETNFVDIVPQAKRLRLSLNMKFNEVNDPRGLCNDVTLLGRWGNGDVEVGLSSLEELPYVIGLVRQALDKQLGEGGSL